MKLALICVLLALEALAEPKRVLYMTHSAGFRHDSIILSRQVLSELAIRSNGRLEVVATEDLSLLNEEALSRYDAVFFFTSGELAINSSQKSALLDFVQRGKGFGGVHSATDTLYGWPEYGEMLGGYFDGHPWVHEAGVDVEDPDNPIVNRLGTAFRITEEFYQFRSFSREKVRILLTLDTKTVDLKAPGVNRTDRDFVLAWIRPFGSGRVFYTALGHFDDTWRDERFQEVLQQALLWLTGQLELDASPRMARPVVQRITDVAPGAVVTVSGEQLTTGSSIRAGSTPLPVKLAGTEVFLDNSPAPLLSVAPDKIEAQVPFGLQGTASMTLSAGNSGTTPVVTPILAAAPRIVAVAIDRQTRTVTVYATGLGEVNGPVPAGTLAPSFPLASTIQLPELSVANQRLDILYSGLAPGQVALYQINGIARDPFPEGTLVLELRIGEQAVKTLAIPEN